MGSPQNWDRVEEFARTTVGAPNQTIRPPDGAGLRSLEGRALAGLSALTSAASSSARLEVLGTLGEGGMGIVRLGRQVALDREVAIKELTDARRGDQKAVVKLLQEAWVAGSLEHPNIVPIYDIELKDQDEPRIVMKRIQGAPWSELINDAEALEERFGETDLLVWNLEVLMAVANALRFAHARGIVHLDVKPDNVMIGTFGEVYLVDWGLGMSLGDDRGGRFPLAAANVEIIGTPAYLAPEMLTGEGAQLSAATDVFLMGSVLCEILTGRPPHRGASMLSVLYKAATEGPELPDSIPGEIRRVCQRAMELVPADRFGDAEAFRAAVRDFVQHRGSIRLVDEAARQLEMLQALADAGPGEDTSAHWSEAHRLFTEARFGCRQALVEWPDNEVAARISRETVVSMVEHTLAFGTATAAATMLSELDDPPADLRARVEAGLVLAAGEADRVRKLQMGADDMDLRIGRRTRLFVLGGLGVLWIAYPIVIWAVDSQPAISDRFVAAGIFLAVAAGLGWYGRESMSSTLVNRRLFALVITMLSAQIVLGAVTALHGVPLQTHSALLFFLWTLCAVFGALLVEVRLWPTAVAQGIGLVAVCSHPPAVVLSMVLANIVFLTNISIIWWPGTISGPYDGDTRAR